MAEHVVPGLLKAGLFLCVCSAICSRLTVPPELCLNLGEESRKVFAVQCFLFCFLTYNYIFSSTHTIICEAYSFGGHVFFFFSLLLNDGLLTAVGYSAFWETENWSVLPIFGVINHCLNFMIALIPVHRLLLQLRPVLSALTAHGIASSH